MRKFGLIIIVCAVSFFWMIVPGGDAAGGKGQEEKPLPGGTLRLKPFINVLNTNFDPAKIADVFLLEQIYDGLVRLDKDLNIAPALAEYWSISPDGRTSTFFLRRGVQFHDGRGLTSEDVKYSLERLLDRGTGSRYHQVFLNRVSGARAFWEGRAPHVTGFRAVDKYTFEIQWTEPYVSSLYLLSMYYCKILPRDLVRTQGDEFFWKPVGTGPFRFTFWLRSPRLDVVGVRLERNERYFSGRPHLQAIEYSPYYTLDHFRDGEIDIIPFLSPGLSDSKCYIQEEGSLELVFLALSCDLPPLDNPAVRRALSLALNRSRVARAATSSESLTQPLQNFIPPRLPGFYPAEEDWPVSPEEAERLLSREGYTRERPLPSLALFIPKSRRDSLFRVFREVQGQLEDAGFRVSLRLYDRQEEILASRRPYLALIEWRMDFPDADSILRPLFYSKSLSNYSRYANPQFDKRLEMADVQRSWSKRLDLFRQAEKLLAADVPAIPMYSNLRRLAIRPDIRGVEVPPLGLSYLNTSKIWIRHKR